MLVPKPKKAFQSPGVHSFGLFMAVIRQSPFHPDPGPPTAATALSDCYQLLFHGSYGAGTALYARFGPEVCAMPQRVAPPRWRAAYNPERFCLC